MIRRPPRSTPKPSSQRQMCIRDSCGSRPFPRPVHGFGLVSEIFQAPCIFLFDPFWPWLGCAGLNTVSGPACKQSGARTTQHDFWIKACPMNTGFECNFGGTRNVTLMHLPKTNAIRCQTHSERLLPCAWQFLSATRPTSPDRCDARWKATRAHRSGRPRACL